LPAIWRRKFSKHQTDLFAEDLHQFPILFLFMYLIFLQELKKDFAILFSKTYLEEYRVYERSSSVAATKPFLKNLSSSVFDYID
jgi:hypothetical protein